MPEDNIALVNALIDAINARDTERVLALVDPEVRFEPLRAGTEGAYIGHDGMRRYMEDTRESFDLAVVTMSETFEIEDGVVGIGTFRVRGKGSGAEVEVPGAAVARYRDGLLTEFRDYGNRQKALEAAGLA
jgi:ketosteroid isomerase-like protein